jgi:hypothetical protein
MRFVQAALFLAVTTSPALAQREPQIVIPGRADVPVIINGVNASWGVVVGEFGLDRPGEMAPVVIYQPLLLSTPYFGAGPVTEYPDYPMPPVIVEPTFGGRRHGPPLKHGVGPLGPGPSGPGPSDPVAPITPPIGP